MKYDKNFDTITLKKEDGLKLTKEELCELLFTNNWGRNVSKSDFSEERWEELKTICELERKLGIE